MAADEKMMAAAVKSGPPAGPGTKISFEAGEGFLLDSVSGETGAAPLLTVVLNWDTALKK